ncbi:MAG: metallophosphoesterase [Candidatus Woesearchaeota archaeon]|jgi:Icc-related predicted phosphoesterase
MKILAAGDIHGDQSLATRLANKAEKENVDLVILTGDITNFDESPDNILGKFLKKKKKVLFVPGNHDSFATADFLVSMYGVKNIHGYSVKYDNIGIFGCGGANIGPVTKFQEKELFDILGKGFKEIKDLQKKIMVTHVHPSETAMEKFSDFIAGSKGVTKAIHEFKPDFLLCSHVHEAEGIEEMVGKTKVINVGKEGTIINL